MRLPAGPASISQPSSAHPGWITPELVARTIAVWQRRSPDPVTADDAVRILENVGHLIDVLTQVPPAPTGEREKPARVRAEQKERKRRGREQA
jgi:hypothetical protein